MKADTQNDSTIKAGFGLAIFVAIALLGLFYVKWFPYYNKAFFAAANHSIGSSIVMGMSDQPPVPSFDAAIDYALAYGKAIWQAMVLGLILGSGLQALLPVEWIAKLLGNTGFSSVARGGLLSIPSMMCTCCAAPVVVGLRERQSSPGAAISFWLGNTVLNPATLVFMGFVLGWNWVALRLVLGTLMVFGLGYFVNRMITSDEAKGIDQKLAGLANRPHSGLFARWFAILWRMAARLIPEYIILLLLLGAARAWLFPHMGPDIGNTIGWIVALAIAGTLFVIPTAGEVPIIQAMLALGVGVGPAGALLMTLPPISIPSVTMISRSFRPATLLFVTLSVVTFGIAGGLLAVIFGF